MRTGGVVACVAALLASGCGPPEIETGDLRDADARACSALVADLPDTLSGETAVEVAGDAAYGAAWGDPAIVLTCGVDAVDISEAPPCVVADGVGWVTPETEGDATLTADGYRPRVRLVVPEDYLPEGSAAALAELAGPIKEHLELEERCL
ncbi:MAG: DUF3515 domain-containing protein [Nocardioides sp.]